MKTIYATVLALCLSINLLAATEKAVGKTEVAKWQGDAKACFMLMFDDSWPSHYQMAAPELAKRKLTATFYINPGKGEYKTKKAHWEGDDAVWKQGMVYGNHTMTHNGMQDLKDAAWEIEECNRIIINTVPGKKRRLISWGRPGVKTWNITKEQTQELLDKNLLISRPTFRGHGVVYHLKKVDQMLSLADKAIAEGGMEYLIAHGVERGPKFNWSYQDFWPWKLDNFRAVLDGVAERRDRGDLWVTDHISYHKYKTERDKATVKTVSATPKKIQVELTADVDQELYDIPLTLKTTVPKSWKYAQIEQDKSKQITEVKNGDVIYDALPNGKAITLTQATAQK